MGRKQPKGGAIEPPPDDTAMVQGAESDQTEALQAGNQSRALEPTRSSAELEVELAAARNQIAELNERWMRSAAELENFRRRAERGRAELRASTEQSILRQLLPVMDNFERALEVDANAAPQAFREGVELIAKLLSETLSRLGVNAIAALGQNFDPELHEALEYRSDDTPPGTVIAEHQKGYRLGERLLRPAQVAVSSGTLAGAAETEADTSEAAEANQGED